jgi:hypothetical protein
VPAYCTWLLFPQCLTAELPRAATVFITSLRDHFGSVIHLLSSTEHNVICGHYVVMFHILKNYRN